MPRHASKLFTHHHFPSLGKPERGRVYFFLGFGGTIAAYSPVILRLCRNGFSVVAFRFSVRKTLAMRQDTLRTGIDDVCKTVKAYEAKRTDGLQAISFGNSMGSVYAWHVAQRVKSIDKVVANTGYALISKMTFEWKRSQSDKRGWYKELTEKGYTQETFHQEIRDYEPITHFDKLKGKKVLLFMNRADNVINFEHARIFKDALERYGIDYTYIETSNKTHGRAVARNLLGRKVMDFLLGQSQNQHHTR